MSKAQATFYEVLNKSAETKTVDILMYGSIPSWEEDTYKMKNTAERFVKEFKALEKDFDRINIHINSPGGSVYHGFPIFNAIASSKRDIHTYNDGLAASMGGVLLLAGKKVHSAKNALLMIHSASSITMGNRKDMLETAEMLEKYDGIIAQHFADKSGKDVAEIKEKYLNYKDHWLTAEEGMEQGFLDEIEDYESEDAPPSDIKNMAFTEVMAMYKPKEKEGNLIERITNKIRKTFAAQAAPISPEGGEQPNTTPTTPITDMNFETSNTLLSKETLTAEDIAAIRAEVAAYRTAGERFTTDEVQAQITAALAPVQDEVTALATAKLTLESEVSNLTTEKTTLTETITNLTNENTGIKATLEAYRKTGVKIDNAKAAEPDKIQGEEKDADNFYSEADAEVKALREQAGITAKK